MKGDFQNAYNFQAATDYSGNAVPPKTRRRPMVSGASPRPRPAAGSGPHAGRPWHGGGSGRGPSRCGAPASAPVTEAAKATSELSYGGEIQQEAGKAQASVRNIGNRTFYRRQNQWVDSQVTTTQQQNARKVKQFSQEYFDLANRYGRSMSQYLAMDEAVMINLEGQAYLIEP